MPLTPEEIEANWTFSVTLSDGSVKDLVPGGSRIAVTFDSRQRFEESLAYVGTDDSFMY